MLFFFQQIIDPWWGGSFCRIEKDLEGQDHFDDLFHCLFVIFTRGWTVFLLFRLPKTCHALFQRSCCHVYCCNRYVFFVEIFCKHLMVPKDNLWHFLLGILSVIAQTGLLTCLMKTLGSKHTIMVGLLFEMLQLMWYGFGSQTWMMWAAGILAAISRYVNLW